MNSDNQVTVFGANGRVGRGVVAALRARHIRVIAAVHSHHDFIESDELQVVKTDVYDRDSVARALQGSTIVISTLGSWGTKRQDVLTAGMTNIIAAMEQQSILRIVSLTGAESRAPHDTFGIIHRLMHTALRIMAPKILCDGEAHISLLESSRLDWTVVRSPIMSSREHRGHGHLSVRRPYPWQLISRRYVVAAIVECVIDGSWLKQVPYIV